jgi:2,5-diamino-6-(ribosylamino)-4(3H)-pyrimidinone 5'-phosphate reductase
LHDETPKLTVKSERLREQRLARGLPANPAKVGIASKLELEPDCEFLTAGPARIMLFTTLQTGQAQLAMLRSRNAEVFVLGEDHVDLAVAMGVLNKHGVRRLLVEGGGSLNFELMDLGLADELTAYIAPIIFGGATAPTMADGAGRPGTAALPLKLVRSEAWEDGGVLLHYQFLKEG